MKGRLGLSSVLQRLLGLLQGTLQTNMAVQLQKPGSSGAQETGFVLTECDIPGAKLPKNVEECGCSVLRRWLLCWGAKTSGKLAVLKQR